MDNTSKKDNELQAEKVFAGKKFEVWFQPIFNYASKRLVGAECLSRSRDDNGNLIYPAGFIPQFEESGEITDLDMYVFEYSCSVLRQWIDKYQDLKGFSLSINLSRLDFNKPDFLNILEETVKKYSIPRDMINFEITETAFVKESSHMIRNVEEMHNVGYQIEMDDFGSGYSSMNALGSLPIDILKFDAKFLSQSAETSKGGKILFSIIRMSKWLNMQMIAEGVETKEQADYLKSIGCNLMQGYYFSRPLLASDFEEQFISRYRLSSFSQGLETSFTELSAFWNSSSDITMLFDLYLGGTAIIELSSGNISALRTNDRFLEISNFTREEFETWSTHLQDIYQGEEKEKLYSLLKRASESKKEESCDLLSLSLNSHREVYTMTKAIIISSTEGSELFFVTIEDITKRKELEKTNERLLERINNIMKSLPGAVFSGKVVEDRLVITFFSEYLPSLLGYHDEEFEDKCAPDFLKIVHLDDRNRVFSFATSITNKAEGMEKTKCRVQRRDGGYIWIQISGTSQKIGKINYINGFVFDVNEEVKRQYVLEKQALELTTLYDTVPCGILRYKLVDGVPILADCNKMSWVSLGYQSKNDFLHSFSGFFLTESFINDEVKTMENVVEKAIKERKKSSDNYKVKLPNGKMSQFRVFVDPLSAYGQDNIIQLVYYDITDATNKETLEYGKTLMSIFDEIYIVDLDLMKIQLLSSNLKDDYMIYSMDLDYQEAESAYKNVDPAYLDKIRAFFEPHNIKDAVNRGITPSIEYMAFDKNREKRWYNGTILKMSSGRYLFCKQNVDDIKRAQELKQSNEELTILAETDAVTQLRNRYSAQKMIEKRLSEKPENEIDSLIMIDIDSFKQINDTIGHSEGDRALRIIAREIQSVFRKNDIMARYGGDEFIVYLSDINDSDLAKKKVGGFLTEILKYEIDKIGHITCSVGIVNIIGEDRDYLSIFKKVDYALYKSKGLGKNLYTVFDKETMKDYNDIGDRD
ncbi:MAG: EAL domain-containing protein [Bacillales bacterium]|nr:EAL domain-containing protein [Bacillales bacterium]